MNAKGGIIQLKKELQRAGAPSHAVDAYVRSQVSQGEDGISLEGRQEQETRLVRAFTDGTLSVREVARDIVENPQLNPAM